MKLSKYTSFITIDIAPLCGGGCKQRAMENSNRDECIFGYTEADKDRIILDILEYHIQNCW